MRDELLHLAQGVLVYRGNRLVRRLQGRFNEIEEQARIVADLMQEELGSSAEGEVRLGKRTFSQRNADSQRDCLLAHLFKQAGVVSIFPHACKTSIEKTVSIPVLSCRVPSPLTACFFNRTSKASPCSNASRRRSMRPPGGAGHSRRTRKSDN